MTAAFVAGHYFGASRVFATLARWLRGDAVSLNHWMTYELLGVLGGAFVGENALLRFYVLHCVFIPVIAVTLMAVHFWRVRKDGGISGPL